MGVYVTKENNHVTIHLDHSERKNIKIVVKTVEQNKQVKRGATDYNLFISNALKLLAFEHPNLPSSQRMKYAQQMYRESKGC